MIIETYGAGYASTEKWFLNCLKPAVDSGLVIYNVSQRYAGGVEQGEHETSPELEKIAIVGGADITTEAAVAKFMHLIANSDSKKEVKKLLATSLRGEMRWSFLIISNKHKFDIYFKILIKMSFEVYREENRNIPLKVIRVL